MCGAACSEPSFVYLVVADCGLVDGAVGVGLPHFGSNGRLDFAYPSTQSASTQVAAAAALYAWRYFGRFGAAAAERWISGDGGLLRQSGSLGTFVGRASGGGSGAAVCRQRQPH